MRCWTSLTTSSWKQQPEARSRRRLCTAFLKSDPENPVNPVGPPFAPAPCAVRRAPSSSVRAPFSCSAGSPSACRSWSAKSPPAATRSPHTATATACASGLGMPNSGRPPGSKRLLEDILGAEVAGFRAPNFSVDDRVLHRAGVRLPLRLELQLLRPARPLRQGQPERQPGGDRPQAGRGLFRAPCQQSSSFLIPQF